VFSHQYFSAQYFQPVWFAPGDESHLLPEEIKPDVEWLGGGYYYGKRDDKYSAEYSRHLDKQQSEEEKRQQRIDLGIIEDDKIIESVAKEKVRVKAKKDNVTNESPDYWSIHLYEHLLNEELAKLRTEILLRNIQVNVINQLRQNEIEAALLQRQADIEYAYAVEYQRIIDEDIFFIMSIMAEI
jgi:hypothetical protein